MSNVEAWSKVSRASHQDALVAPSALERSVQDSEANAWLYILIHISLVLINEECLTVVKCKLKTSRTQDSDPGLLCESPVFDPSTHLLTLT